MKLNPLLQPFIMASCEFLRKKIVIKKNYAYVFIAAVNKISILDMITFTIVKCAANTQWRNSTNL